MTVHILCCAYECPDALVKCLASIYAQDYPHMTVTVVDDASIDQRQRDIVTGIEKLGWRPVLNTERVGATANIWTNAAALNMGPDDVLFLIDGDDYLPHRKVISEVAAVYDHDPDCWLTYGSYRSDPFDPDCPAVTPYPIEVIRDRSFRSASNMFNHPLTFRGLLWNELREDDLRLASGDWVPAIYDEAIMYPMLEMAGPNHRHLEQTLYVYCSDNPLSCIHTQLPAMEAAGLELRARPKKPRLYRAAGGLVFETEDRAALITRCMLAHGLTWCVETGTGYGDMDERISEHEWVTRVITIESDPDRYGRAVGRLIANPKIELVFGDSRDAFRWISDGTPPAVWWIDSHPEIEMGHVMDELFVIMSRKQPDVILIDDARLFTGTAGRPTIEDVRGQIQQLSEAFGAPYDVDVAYDVIRITPQGELCE